MKLRLPTNLSVSVLNTWPTNSPARFGSSVDLLGLVAAALGGRALLALDRRQARSVHDGVEQLGDADVLLGGRAEDRDRRCRPPAPWAGPRPARRSLTSPSIRYFSISASSASTMASTSLERAAARSTGQPAGAWSGGLSTLTTPLKSWPGVDRRVEQHAALAEGVAGWS